MHKYIQGFDEYMNIVLDAAEEVNTKTGAKRAVGKQIYIYMCI
jgi:small nuclear ribonucleoprotein (snRNP)-like protein